MEEQQHRPRNHARGVQHYRGSSIDVLIDLVFAKFSTEYGDGSVTVWFRSDGGPGNLEVFDRTCRRGVAVTVWADYIS